MTLFAFIYLLILCAHFLDFFFFFLISLTPLRFAFVSFRILRFCGPRNRTKINYDYLNDLDFGLWSFYQTIFIRTSPQSRPQLETETHFLASARTTKEKQTFLFDFIFFFCVCDENRSNSKKRNSYSHERMKPELRGLFRCALCIVTPSALLT